MKLREHHSIPLIDFSIDTTEPILFTRLILIQNEDETETQLRRYKNTATKSLNDLLISIDVDDFNW